MCSHKFSGFLERQQYSDEFSENFHFTLLKLSTKLGPVVICAASHKAQRSLEMFEQLDFGFILLFGVISALGFIGNSYSHFAQAHGWPVGRWFSRGPDAPTTLIETSFAWVPLSFILGWYHEGFVTAVLIVFFGFFLALMLTNMFKQYVQVVWLLTTFVIIGYFGLLAFKKYLL